MGPLKDEKKILEIIAELERIQKEDLPRMAMLDKSFLMNGEWQDSFEVESMLYCALAASYAGQERKETRGYNLRTDYPNTDNSYRRLFVSIINEIENNVIHFSACRKRLKGNRNRLLVLFSLQNLIYIIWQESCKKILFCSMSFAKNSTTKKIAPPSRLKQCKSSTSTGYDSFSLLRSECAFVDLPLT